ncbi:hypothetical protein ACFLRP_02725 [Bacteroidota bacterium]
MLKQTERPENKRRTRDGSTPSYRVLHEVYITKDFGPERNKELVAFISKRIAAYQGKTEDKHGIPLMLFDRRQDAQKFANEFSARLNVPKEHITIKPR